jgi:anti-sigma regulatory factor (Ser/Thr protein kinase)
VGLEECADFESDLGAVTLARAFVRATLMSWEMAGLIFDVELLTSELVTNAVLHARTALRLTLHYDEAGLTVSVLDGNMRLPTVAGVPAQATSGRGLVLVERLADAWGVEQNEEGKTVWARIGSAGPEPESDCADLTETRHVDDLIAAMDDADDGRPDPEVGGEREAP